MKQYLNDVVVIRLILIVLLVQYHAFAIYNGAWQMPNGVQSVETYWWIATISYSFLLETFVFVSGYVFGFQVRNNPLGKITAKKCVIKKAKRLLIPSIVFSLVYFICFEREAYISCSSCIYDIINGEGHMWFLPMLFWCFVATFAFEKLHIPCKVVVLLAILASILSLMTLPFRISTAAYYFVFFYTGYYIQRNGLILKDIKGNTVILAGLIFVIVFLVSKIFLDNVLTASFESESSLYKIFFLLAERLSKICYSSLGIVFIYFLTNYLIISRKIAVTERMVKLSSYCFGIYIFQQFILKFIVYNEFAISCFGTYWLPWVSFIIAMVGSMLFTWLFQKSKIGRFLIG